VLVGVGWGGRSDMVLLAELHYKLLMAHLQYREEDSLASWIRLLHTSLPYLRQLPSPDEPLPLPDELPDFQAYAQLSPTQRVRPAGWRAVASQPVACSLALRWHADHSTATLHWPSYGYCISTDRSSTLNA